MNEGGGKMEKPKESIKLWGNLANMPGLQIKPYRDSHSISEVVLKLYLSEKFSQPSIFGALAFEEPTPLFTHVKFINPNSTVKGPVINDMEELHRELEQVTGCELMQFVNDELTWIVRLQNPISEDDELITISIHYLGADFSWEMYAQHCLLILQKLTSLDPQISIIAIGQTFIDQFYWNSTEPFPSHLIFNEKSQYLPSHIKSYQSEYNFSMGGKSKSPEGMDTLEVSDVYLRSFNELDTDKRLNLGLVHLYVKERSDSISLNTLLETSLLDELDTLRNVNTDFITDVFSQGVCELIRDRI